LKPSSAAMSGPIGLLAMRGAPFVLGCGAQVLGEWSFDRA
jgi:hypothetical protein